MSFSGRVLVYGGKGALGSNIVKHFKAKNWWVVSLDINSNEDAHSSVLVQPGDSWLQQNEEVTSKMAAELGSEKFDAVLCVAGGWAGGSSASKDFVKNCDLVWKQSVWTSVVATAISSKYLKEGGLLVLTGAQAALSGTPGMVGYGMAKAAVHHLVQSLSMPKSGLPKLATVTAILPTTLDTPMNRKFMSTADFSTWTPLDTVSSTLFDWATNVNKPVSGSLVQLITTAAVTSIVAV